MQALKSHITLSENLVVDSIIEKLNLFQPQSSKNEILPNNPDVLHVEADTNTEHSYTQLNTNNNYKKVLQFKNHSLIEADKCIMKASIKYF